MKISLPRRKFFGLGLGALAALPVTRSLAQICGEATAEQPLGPFFPHPGTLENPVSENDSDLTFVQGRRGMAEGQIVHIVGQVTHDCHPISGATLIIWQAGHSGRYNHKGDAESQSFLHPQTGELIRRTLDPSFQYWGRTVTDHNGNYRFKTIVPGFYPADLQSGWYRPPHIHFLVSATGFPQLVTQMYFDGDDLVDNPWIQELNEQDFLLQNPNMSDEQKRKLIVIFTEQIDGLTGRFDINLT
ncbi:MAG: protocatechuate 3,4-dioxygenase [Bacteriovoracales bacterium]|nr:protocatechuate 3,4-dioxygenase [Bacteriovoracales bacterium]